MGTKTRALGGGTTLGLTGAGTKTSIASGVEGLVGDVGWLLGPFRWLCVFLLAVGAVVLIVVLVFVKGQSMLACATLW